MSQSLTRRRFFEGAAALGALAALSGCSPKVSESEDLANTGEAPEIEAINLDDYEIKYSWCYMCGPAKHFCATKHYLKDGRWLHVEGNPEGGNNWGYGSRTLCAKGNAAMQTLYNPARLQYPMKRVGEKGEGKFERCTWEEAIEAIAAKLLENREKYGPESYGALSPQSCEYVQKMGRRFLNVYGSPNYLHSAICAMQIYTAWHTTVGPATKVNPGQLDKCKLLVNWGSNCENTYVNHRDDEANPCARLDAQEAGCEVIDIRPLLDPLVTHADEWVPIRPGTDTALGLAILNVIIGEDLYDHDFCDKWVNGFDKLAEHVKQYPPSWAAEKTGLPEEQIVRIARKMGTVKPMGLVFGNGAGDQMRDGYAATACINLIGAITGNMETQGGGGAALIMPDPVVDISNVNSIPTLSEKLPSYPEDEAAGYAPSRTKLIAPEFPRWFQSPEYARGGYKEPSSAYNRAIRSVLDESAPIKLRSLFGHSSNPMSATRQPKEIAEALKKLDFYFVMDTAWNSSCDYADYVLPACTRFEDSCQMYARNMPEGTFIGIEQKMAEPLGESRSDWRIYCDLAVAMGMGEDFWNGDFDQCLREMLEGTGVTLEELREKGYVFFKREGDGTPTEPVYQNYEEMFTMLPNNKVQAYNELLGGKLDNMDEGELPYLPVYQGPPEGIAETPELLDEYPLIFSDVHGDRRSIHSYFGNVPYLRERNRLPWVKINPATAQQYGIEDGDWMKIESPHGWVKMVAEYFEGVSPEVLMGKRGWWQDCEELGEPGYGCLDGGSEVNVLYDSTIDNYDKFHAAMAKQTLVKISKWEG
ncbi:molybdopterin-dependent oxidoreductase [uncultured Adlercreutzia sp.]|uniref:molybdopterin-containing oxidoreductase family protein n=1 Tax=uncultured Adlercreutzia sp. TaxID=875803 RepID=UPI00266B4DDC|nr:molybdopterin-dependent oxidoreductase [uncultured Adlercreutzia sp.]